MKTYIFLFLTFLATAFLFVQTSPAEQKAGSIVGWGDNYYGQADPPEGNDFIAIATGGDIHGLALKSDGSIVGWGSNYYWDETTWLGQATPPEGNDFVAVAAGAYYSLALKSDGTIVGWGDNYYGQADPPEGNDFIAISAGYVHGLALKSDGTIVGWGDNGFGVASPPAGNDFVAIAAGDFHSCALKSDGSIVGWGAPYIGSPPAGTDFVAIAAGALHGLALKSDGSIAGWGLNLYGEATPPAGNDFVAISCGYWHSLALKADGSIVGWGYDGFDQATPPEGNDFVAIAAGYWHSLALEAQNLPPVANAGLDQTNVGIGTTVQLDGTQSYDPDGDPIDYYWDFLTVPFDSSATLSDPASATPTFVADVQGEYVIELVVGDPWGWSDPDTVTIIAITYQQAAVNTIVETIEIVNDLPPNTLKNKNSIKALTNKLNAVLRMIDEGSYRGAQNKLEHDILQKTDGCAEVGEPDRDDWIITCEEQDLVYPLVVQVIELLDNLIY